MKQTVVLGTYGKTRGHEHSDLISALRHDLGLLVLETRGNAHIDEARSLLATTALAHGADVMVFIDHDTLFDPLDVERLADVARETSGVVGAPYAQRRLGAGMVGAIDPEVGEAVFFEGGGLYKATGVIGMGFTAIHRRALELLDALPEYAEVTSSEGLMRPYFKKLVVDGFWLKEDASFCHAVRQAGGSTMIDTRIRVKHLGEHPFGIEDCLVKPADKPSLRLRLKPT